MCLLEWSLFHNRKIFFKRIRKKLVIMTVKRKKKRCIMDANDRKKRLEFLLQKQKEKETRRYLYEKDRLYDTTT